MCCVCITWGNFRLIEICVCLFFSFSWNLCVFIFRLFMKFVCVYFSPFHEILVCLFFAFSWRLRIRPIINQGQNIPQYSHVNIELLNKIWVTVVYRVINNSLEFWCVGINHARHRPKWLITSIRTTNRCKWADIWR